VEVSKWATFNRNTNANANGGSQYIAPCQGFFVSVTDGTVPTTGTLNMTNAVRTHNATSFFKNSDEIVNNMVRMEVSGNGYTDEAVVMFLSEASTEFDGEYDAHKLFGDVAEAAQLYSLGSIPLVINTLPEPVTVPVGVHVGINGTYTIAATEINDIPVVILEDTKTGIFTDLLAGPYTFNFETGENEVRFMLHFGTTGLPDPEKAVTNIYSYQQTVFIDLKDQAKGDIFIYNTAGQMVSKHTASQGMNEVKLQNTGIYMVKVVTAKATTTKKVWIE